MAAFCNRSVSLPALAVTGRGSLTGNAPATLMVGRPAPTAAMRVPSIHRHQRIAKAKLRRPEGVLVVATVEYEHQFFPDA